MVRRRVDPGVRCRMAGSRKIRFMRSLSKFDQLRLKTDRELIELITHELDLGFRAALEALNSGDHSPSAENYLPTDENVIRLISLLSESSADERNWLQSRLEHLRVMVRALSAGLAPAPAEEEIARLARAMWEARGRPEGMAELDWFRAEQFLQSRAESYAVCVAG
jgi:hypothetical protein